MDDSSRHSDYYSANFRVLNFLSHYSEASATKAEIMSDIDHLPVRQNAYSVDPEEQNV